MKLRVYRLYRWRVSFRRGMLGWYLRLGPLWIALLLSACTAAQIQSSTATIAGLCSAYSGLAAAGMAVPVAREVAMGVVAGCASSAAINRLASDPGSAAWLDRQAAILRALLAKAHG